MKIHKITNESNLTLTDNDLNWLQECGDNLLWDTPITTEPDTPLKYWGEQCAVMIWQEMESGTYINLELNLESDD